MKKQKTEKALENTAGKTEHNGSRSEKPVCTAETADYNYLVNYAIGRSGGGGVRSVALDAMGLDDEVCQEIDNTIKENRLLQQAETERFLEESPAETVSVSSKDGLKLSGVYYKKSGSHLWVIGIHGYRGDHNGMTDYAQKYYAHGYQVLTPDLRACGDSEGDYVGMGWLERLDIISWISWIVKQDADAKIVLHGISMGAATVMMTSGEELPDNVKVFVEDCGYTSAWDIFASELSLRFRLPTFPIMDTANLIAVSKAGYDFKEASSLKQVAKCNKPMLFIHGTADDFVPYEMVNTLYAAKMAGDKEILTAEGAGHARAMLVLGEAYWNKVFEFVDRHMQ